MNLNLAQLAGQLQAVWKQLGINQRVSIVLAIGVVAAFLGATVYWSTRADYALLYGRLEEAEAAKVVAALDDAKVPYQISRGGGTIMVPADKVHQMRMQLAAKGIPRAGDGVGFEIFDKPNFGISDFVQRANYLRAVQGELSRTISQVDSIESARVLIVLPENRLLVDNSKKPTASVFVRVRGNGTLPAQNVNAIRFLVANAVEGLKATSVSVIDNQGNVLSDNNDGDSLAGMSSTQLTARKEMEKYLSTKAEDMLNRVLGPGQAVVKVSAEINFDTISMTEDRFDPDGSVLRLSTINDENIATSTPQSGGVPGMAANANVDTNSTASSSSNNNSTKKKVTTSQYEINKVTSTTQQAAGSLKRLTAAIFVAARYEGTGATRKLVPRSAEEVEKLRRIVQNAIGIQEGADKTRPDQIVLEEIAFNDQQAMEITTRLENDQKKEFYWELARNVAYPLLGLALVGFFWRTFRRLPQETIPIGIPLSDRIFGGNGFSNGNGNGHGNGHGNGFHFPKPRHGNGDGGMPSVVTVDVLNQLIRENPDNMTQAIRNWMTRGKTK